MLMIPVPLLVTSPLCVQDVALLAVIVPLFVSVAAVDVKVAPPIVIVPPLVRVALLPTLREVKLFKVMVLLFVSEPLVQLVTFAQAIALFMTIVPKL